MPNIATSPKSRPDPQTALLDAAERMLLEVGYAGVTTRTLAAEAGVNHGLVHYYFGSMETLILRVVERATEQLIERQRLMYSAEEPFRKKWRRAMRFLEKDLEGGYPKILFELVAMSWNNSRLQEPLRRVGDAWRQVLREAFTQAADEYGMDVESFPIEAWVTLVMTFNTGMLVDRLGGDDTGHRVLLHAIDRWFAQLEQGKA